MVRLVLLLLIVGGLAIFVIQNMPPIALMFLGMQTPALPLGVWVVVAIAAGALTTLVIAGLASLGRSVASSRRTPPRRASQFSAGSFRSPWQSGGEGRKPQAASARSANSIPRNAGDDWETSTKAKEEWEDWEGYTEPEPTDRKSSSRAGSRNERLAEVRDREDEVWANWDGYEGAREPIDLDEAEPGDRTSAASPTNPPPPKRTDFEVKQEPATQHQSGSVYSYSYRKPGDSEVGEADETGARNRVQKTENVYDADYRVITPPHKPDPEEFEPLPQMIDEEDWDFETDEPIDADR